MKTLREWLPSQQDTFGLSIEKFLDFEIIEEMRVDGKERSDHYQQPFTHKNIYNWCVITNGKKTYAVGFNENPAIGWSFPYKKLENMKTETTHSVKDGILTSTTKKELGKFEFVCDSCETLHTMSHYAIAQLTMGNAIDFTCECKNVVGLEPFED